ncbi:MAG: hypothetical protein E7096_01885 [Bacteroides sp.]|nr:hypothetical protein [Bacteroides sp.]
MEIRIQINDVIYAKLLNGTSRVQGSIGLVNPTEGNFNAHNRSRSQANNRYMKLPHGRISVNDDNVRLHLCIHRDESVVPARAIEAESSMASNFVDFMEEIV